MKAKAPKDLPSEDQPQETAAGKPPLGPERERKQFRALLLANPNYFGNIKVSPFQPVVKIQLNTTYEELGCVGFQPQFNRLDGVVYVKRPFGYGGNICSSGTQEYVRFYLSFDNGATWQDQGLTSFAAYDIPGTTADKPLEYAVTLQIAPPKKFCTIPNLALVRAILSWNAPPPPNDPNFTPVWGNVHETRIQIDPLRLFVLGDLLEIFKIKVPLPLAAAVDLKQAVAASVQALSASQLQARYKEKGVEPHRFALAEIQKLISQPKLSESLMVPGFEGVLPGIDLTDVVGKLFPVDGDTRYEELECIGLNQNPEALVGVLRVKLSSGYSGDPCTAGSKEFVTFWADFNNDGIFEACLGTTSVNVYDIDTLPPEGLEYSVFLPVDLSAHRQPCEEGPRTVKIRAILSWQVPPPCADPNYVPVWGNREETIIHIAPGPSVGEDQVPFLSSVGNIPVLFVDANGLITDAVALQTGAHFVDAPFGGRITIAGHISNAHAGKKYRVMRKPHGAPDLAYVPLTNEPDGLHLILNTWDMVNGWVQTPIIRHADADGYYPHEDYSSNHSIENSIMGVWFSTVAEDGNAYDLRIDLSVDGIPAHDVHSNVVTVLIDNTDPTVALDIDLGVGVECADFNLGVTFTGHYTALDTHFRHFSFVIRPPGPAHGVLPVPPAGSHSVIPAPGLSLIADPGIAGGLYTLNTTGMDACGYALTIEVWDRTNVNSGQTNNRNEASVGFCLRAPEA